MTLLVRKFTSLLLVILLFGTSLSATIDKVQFRETATHRSLESVESNDKRETSTSTPRIISTLASSTKFVTSSSNSDVKRATKPEKEKIKTASQTFPGYNQGYNGGGFNGYNGNAINQQSGNFPNSGNSGLYNGFGFGMGGGDSVNGYPQLGYPGGGNGGLINNQLQGPGSFNSFGGQGYPGFQGQGFQGFQGQGQGFQGFQGQGYPGFQGQGFPGTSNAVTVGGTGAPQFNYNNGINPYNSPGGIGGGQGIGYPGVGGFGQQRFDTRGGPNQYVGGGISVGNAIEVNRNNPIGGGRPGMIPPSARFDQRDYMNGQARGAGGFNSQNEQPYTLLGGGVFNNNNNNNGNRFGGPFAPGGQGYPGIQGPGGIYRQNPNLYSNQLDYLNQNRRSDNQQFNSGPNQFYQGSDPNASRIYQQQRGIQRYVGPDSRPFLRDSKPKQ